MREPATGCSNLRIRCAAFSADAALVVTGSFDGVAKIWSVMRGECLQSLSGHEGLITSVAFSEDCAQVLTSSQDCAARVWNVTDGKCIQVLKGHQACVHSAVFSAG